MATLSIGPKFGSAIKRRKSKRLKELGRAFHVAPTAASKAAIMRSQAATSRAILGTKVAVQKISKERGVSFDAAATILRSVAAGTFKEPPPRAPAATRAGQATRGGIVRGVREVGALGVPPFTPGLRSTTTSRVRRRITGSTLAAGRRTGGATLTGGGRTGSVLRTAGGRTLSELKKFGAGFFGR